MKILISVFTIILLISGCTEPQGREVETSTWEWIGLKVDVVEYKSNRGRTIIKTSTGNCYLKAGTGSRGNWISLVDCEDFGFGEGKEN